MRLTTVEVSTLYHTHCLDYGSRKLGKFSDGDTMALVPLVCHTCLNGDIKNSSIVIFNEIAVLNYLEG